MKLSGHLNDSNLQIGYGKADKYQYFPLHIYQSEKLATMFISTESGTTKVLHESKENYEDAELVCILENGEIDSYGKASIHCHGNSTFDYKGNDKKSYKIKLKKAASILGMDPAKKWIIQSNAFDSSKIRNRVAYHLAEELGLRFAVNTAYVDLYMNGIYAGNYMVLDSINIAKNRIDVPKESSFLICAGRANPDQRSFTDLYGTSFAIKAPDQMTDRQAEEISEYIYYIEEKIESLKPYDSLEELKALIDIESFAIMFLMDNITNEEDSNGGSTYYYYDGANGKLYAGPAWDYDASMGNRLVEKYVEINQFHFGLPEKLWRNKEFQGVVRAIFAEKQDCIAHIPDYIEQNKELIQRSVELDTLRWGEVYDAGTFNQGNYEQNVSYAANYLQQRLDLVEEIVNNPGNYCRIYTEVLENGYSPSVWIKKGDTIPGSILGYLKDFYHCDSLALSNGVDLWDGYSVLQDTRVTPVVGVIPTEQSNEGGTMNLLIFVIVFAPGVLALYISGFTQPQNKQQLLSLLVRYSIYDFLVLTLTYAILYFAKGNVSIAWGMLVRGFDYSISYTNVMFQIMLLQLVGSVFLGLCGRGYRILRENQ